MNTVHDIVVQSVVKNGFQRMYQKIGLRCAKNVDGQLIQLTKIFAHFFMCRDTDQSYVC